MASRAGATFGGSRSRLKKSKEIGSFVTSKIIELHFQDRIFFGSQVLDPYPIWVCLKIGYSNLYQNMPIFHGLSSFFPIKTCNQLGQRSHLQTPNIYDLPWRMFCSTGLGRSAAAGAVARRVGTGAAATYRTFVAAERRGSGRIVFFTASENREEVCGSIHICISAVHIHRYVIIRLYRHVYIHTHIYTHIYKHIQTFPIQESQSLLGTTS